MSNPNRRAGKVFFKIDGKQYDAIGSFTYDLGGVERTTIVGADSVHGYSEKVSVPSISGEITDSADLDVQKLQSMDGVTVTLELANGKTIVLRHAWYVGSGQIATDDQGIPVHFEGKSAEEMK